MKYVLTLIVILFLFSCSERKNIDTINIQKNYNLDWLQGNWIRTNEKVEKQTFENWEKIGSETYVGLGFTLENSDTTFKENLKIVKKNIDWQLEVKGVNPEMTSFIFTNQTESSFTCENELNEFPKKIKYLLKNDTLAAIISADSLEILFHFVKIK